MFERVAPIVPVRDLDAACERYRSLGFDVSLDEGGARYGFVERDAVSFHLTEWPEHDPASNGSAVYLYVDDVDAVHAQWAAAGVEGRLAAPSDTGWGLREFTYVDPDGTLHRVGSPL